MIEYVLVPFIGINLTLFVYYTYLAVGVLKSIKNSNIIYINSLIPLAPVTLYTLLMIDYACYSSTERLVGFYFIEWMISTPLLLISLSSLKNVKTYNYYVLSCLTIFMNMSGYISHQYHLIQSYLVSYIFFGISSFLYCGIIGLLLYLYSVKENTIENSNQYTALNNNAVYKKLMLLTMISWSVYPVIFLLHLLSYIDVGGCIIAFTLLDFSAKSIFTFLTFGYEMHKYNIQSSIANITRRAIRIHPISIPSNNAEPGLADYTLSAIPVITEDSAL